MFEVAPLQSVRLTPSCLLAAPRSKPGQFPLSQPAVLPSAPHSRLACPSSPVGSRVWPRQHASQNQPPWSPTPVSLAPVHPARHSGRTQTGHRAALEAFLWSLGLELFRRVGTHRPLLHRWPCARRKSAEMSPDQGQRLGLYRFLAVCTLFCVHGARCLP